MTAQPSTVRSRIGNQPSRLPTLDGRSAEARRLRDVTSTFVTALGGSDQISAIVMMDVARAAQLQVIAEQLRERSLKVGAAGGTNIVELIRAENAAARARKSLGIKSAANQPQRPDVAAYRVQRAARRATETPASEVA
jgi:hypothetical protein